MKISIVGCGRWGKCIAWYLDKYTNHSVTIYGRENSEKFKLLKERRKIFNKFSDKVNLTSDINDVVLADTIIISTPVSSLESICDELNTVGVVDKKIILAMKGIDPNSLRTPYNICKYVIPRCNDIFVWVGPGQDKYLYSEVPTRMLISGSNRYLIEELIKELSSDLIKFDYSTDLIGTEIGAATKNVIGIAAGILDGLMLSQMKGPLMVKATEEVGRLITLMGGNVLSAYSLSHLGDYQATLFYVDGHNRRYGESLVSNIPINIFGTVEGINTAIAVNAIANKYNTEFPIMQAVYKIIFEKADPYETVS